MMPTYTIEQLRRDGAETSYAMLVEAARIGASVTYGSISTQLERILFIPRIFDIHIGHVVGALQGQINATEPAAPLLNSLAVSASTGLPSRGIDDALTRKFGLRRVPVGNARVNLISKVQNEVYAYGGWHKLALRLFQRVPTPVQRNMSPQIDDGDNYSPWGGPSESDEHKALKRFVSLHPRRLDIHSDRQGEEEAILKSGDKVDVLFFEPGTGRFVAVEVKSNRSSDSDLERGIYQCVKYRAVLEAQRKPIVGQVDTFLITERELPSNLRNIAERLGINHRVVTI
jgi:hypothetical protein